MGPRTGVWSLVFGVWCLPTGFSPRLGRLNPLAPWGAFSYERPVTGFRRLLLIVVLLDGLNPWLALGQIDPVKRELFQFGYNAALEGHPPLAAYAFYYRNDPGFLKTNLTLRLAVAPTYVDSELGFAQALGENTDVGLGVSGGGYADSYNEIDQGKYLPKQSFDGFGGGLSGGLYHLFDPGHLIPLYGVLRGSARYATYAPTQETAPDFQVPGDQGLFGVRTGLRWGGREPTLFPELAMELSIWYEGEFRPWADSYGFNNDRSLQHQSHLFWSEAFLAYTLPEWKHRFELGLTAGTSIDADRFSAYRLGALLPLASEFPLSLPGYFYQELSADQFVLISGNYIVPVGPNHRWNLYANGATAVVDYLPGLEQPGNWNSGVGAGVFYTSPSWRVMLGYGYGIDAIRSSGRGAQSIGILVQLDLTHAKEAFYKPEPASHWRGLQRVIGVLGN
jgi:hypothetical protein